MANLIVKTVDNEQKFALEQTLNQDIVNDSHIIIDFDTENTFIDKDIHVDLTVPTAAEPTLDIFDITTSMDMGQPQNGIYSPEATISGNANIASPGWIASGNRAVAEAGVKIGKVNQSLISNGSTQIASGSTINPSDSQQTITISEGYNTARTLVIGAADSSAAGEVTSGSATISTITYTYDSTNDNFAVDGSATVSAPTVNNAGYISLTKGTRNSNVNGATVDTTVDKISISTTITGNGLKKPIIMRSSPPPTTTSYIRGDKEVQPSSTTPSDQKVYAAVVVPSNTTTITATPTVDTAGYGDTTNFGVGTAATSEVGVQQSDIYYVPIKEGAITSGTASITTHSIAYNSTNGNFDITGTADVSAPTITTEGYIASTVGTVSGNTGGASLTSTLPKISIAAGLSANASTTIAPTITALPNGTNVNIGSLTSIQPSSSVFYIGIQAMLPPPITITGTASVTTAGYGTATSGEYTAVNDTLTINMGSNVQYATIASASFANSATSGTTYNDISSTAPTLISNDYLYINEGYTGNVKISLAKLIPDNATITTSTGADYILSGQSAYDGDGNLIVGSIATYTGSYTIT